MDAMVKADASDDIIANVLSIKQRLLDLYLLSTKQ